MTNLDMVPYMRMYAKACASLGPGLVQDVRDETEPLWPLRDCKTTLLNYFEALERNK